MRVGAHQRGRPVGGVERDFDRPRGRVHRGSAPLSKKVIAPSGCSRASCCQAVATPGPSLKLLCLPPSSPADLAAVRIDVVGRPRVACVDEEAAVALDFHGVDVEGVEGLEARGRAPGVVGARHRHVVEEMPLVADEAGGEVDFLEQRVGDRAFARAADAR